MTISAVDWAFDKASAEPFVEQLVRHATQAVGDGRWKPGERLPSIRQLAERLKVSRFTVADAYERLAAAGLVVSRQGSGVYVARSTQTRRLALEVDASASAMAQEVMLLRRVMDTERFSLKPGSGCLPADWLGDGDIRSALRELARQPAPLTEYGSAQGHPALRRQLGLRLERLDIPADPAQILMASSASHGLDLVMRTLVRPGERVLVDDPGFYNFQALVRLHGAVPVALPRDAEGPDLIALKQALEQHRPVLYLTNSVLSNPLGASVSRSRAYRVLSLLAERRCWLLEDDIYADFDTQQSLRYASLAGFDRLVYLGSLSKTLSADLRAGFLVSNPALIAELTDIKLISGMPTSPSIETIMYRLLTGGRYRRHVEQLRRRLEEVREPTLARFEALGFNAVHRPAGGYFSWLRLPDGLSASGLSQRAAEEGILLAPGRYFSHQPDADQYMRINIAHCQDEKMWRGLELTLGSLLVSG
ncbi:PLP-dependent aminotransferase family protein [Oceanimonas baumannii]|uniref:DNA-binding transcriptional MocR family regulator n=1 Tax=Oceanimonas baumannii TaxID=129578 RepID=A0A235CG81_9GAMM|nr:PLP-dependent aminotransferase family protein [Oceanimonas baumannii]OYD23379.1 transcriptional regulator [Oceanimonas baumannii]TDW58469.1 DNA-binding transcriptional MocR family regulator [Oceanimonas baumannii]